MVKSIAQLDRLRYASPWIP